MVQSKTLNINTIELISVPDLNKTNSLSGVELAKINHEIESNTKKAELSFNADKNVLKPEEDINVFLLIKYTLE